MKLGVSVIHLQVTRNFMSTVTAMSSCKWL